MESLLRFGRKIIPRKVFKASQPVYHYLLALAGALLYRFPSKSIKVIGITGTKGKTSTAEIVNAILEEAGFKTALLGTLRFKIGERSLANLYKMTMPGRFFVQKFLRDAVDAKCDWAVLEMTSEGTKQFRHKFIGLDALIFTNLAKEHIESHGSYENYREAKLKIAKALEQSKKINRAIIANTDDVEGKRFLETKVENRIGFSLKDAGVYTADQNGSGVTFSGTKIHIPLLGVFNIYNSLSALTFGKFLGIPNEALKRAIEKTSVIKGRLEEIKNEFGFKVFVDYAHTPDSLEAVYKTFAGSKIIAVLGNTGGGRDTWKRPEMGKIADQYASEIILTNEDPYDENPRSILDQMVAGIKNHIPKIILDRREAIKTALKIASSGNIILITGKGTDPFIMGPNGTKQSWSDSKVVREELAKLKR